jgi:hypothetical protein
MYVDITRITIILCWIALIAFWCLKLFGGNWFEIMVENENFIKFSDLVQNTWLKHIVSIFTISLSNYLFIGAIIQELQFKSKHLLTYIFSVITMWIVANFVDIQLIKMLYGYIVFILIGIIFQSGFKKLFGLLAVALELTFTIVSMMIRNVNVDIMSDYFITSILIIDVYLMSGLFLLYSNLLKLEGKNDMAILLGFGLLSKEEAQKRGYSNFKRFCHNARYIASFKWAKKK